MVIRRPSKSGLIATAALAVAMLTSAVSASYASVAVENGRAVRSGVLLRPAQRAAPLQFASRNGSSCAVRPHLGCRGYILFGLTF